MPKKVSRKYKITLVFEINDDQEASWTIPPQEWGPWEWQKWALGDQMGKHSGGVVQEVQVEQVE